MDIKNHYIEKGTGQPLILLHGNGEDHTYFKNQIDFFSEKYHVYAPDTRGHGKTPWGNMPFTISQFADDLFDFMEEHEIEKANLLGFSDGGNIALVFATKYPDKVERLILNGANLNANGIKRSVQLFIETAYRFVSRFAKKSEEAKRNAEMLGLMVNEPNVNPEELKKIKAPTLVIAGTNDMIRKEHTQMIADSVEGAELVFIKGNHFIAAKNPKEFNAAVAAFLEKKLAVGTSRDLEGNHAKQSARRY